ncbi:MAG: twin-arginine translocation signal domain-containing protein, partial [Gemmatimonadales bacterium]|nr:twin-arginine translocation signal domain-containing protein [Gemmatimonadales bacterium]
MRLQRRQEPDPLDPGAGLARHGLPRGPGEEGGPVTDDINRRDALKLLAVGTAAAAAVPATPKPAAARTLPVLDP